MSEIPKVLVLGPITPTDNGDQLEYTKLAPAVEKHAPYEAARANLFFEEQPGTLAEEEAARQLAMQYLLMIALREVESPNNEIKDIWANRFTIASSEIYGAPELRITTDIATKEYNYFLQFVGEGHIDQELLKIVLETYKPYVDLDANTQENGKKLTAEAVSAKVHEYIFTKYASVFEILQNSEKSEFTPAEIKEIFGEILKVLAYQDSDWGEWTVELNGNKDSLSVAAGDKKIIVGEKRVNASKKDMIGLTAHEILVHALRNVNGKRLSKELSTGLPGYLDFEEGLGVFFEYSATGIIPQKNTDRYFDIALAIGDDSHQSVPRLKMLAFTEARATIRSQINGDTNDPVVVKSKIAAHVNRIYRGTSGTEAVGVYTKDIAYHKGFCLVADYIADELAAGRTIEDIIEYLLMGKFSPLDNRHNEYINILIEDNLEANRAK